MTYDEYVKQYKSATAKEDKEKPGEENPQGAYDRYMQMYGQEYESKFSAGGNSMLQGFASAYRSFVETANSDFKTLGYANAGDMQATASKSAKELLSKSSSLKAYLAANRGYMSDKDYGDTISFINGADRVINDAMSQYNNSLRFYSQWDTEEAYNSWYKKESFISAYLADPEKAKSTMDHDARWIKEADLRAENKEVLAAEDFSDYSKYVSTKNGGFFDKLWSQYSMGYDDLTYEYINNQNNIRKEISGKSRAYSSDTKDRASSFEDHHYEHMTEDEVAIYNYYYAKEGKARAEAYLDAIASVLEERANEETVVNVSKFSAEHPILSSIASVGTSVGSGFEYIEDVLDYGADILSGKEASIGTNEAALMTNAVRGTVSDMVNWEIGNWDAFDFLYSTAMSGVDSFASSLMFGNLGGVVLGLSAAAQGTNDAIERGMSSGQAFWNGLFSGVFEGLFESVSIGNFNKLKEVAPDGLKAIIKNLGKSMLVNASEETLTEIANIGYDTLINGEFANYTWEELKNGAWKDALAQVIEAGASGALMGLGMGGAGNAIGYYKGGKNAMRIYGDNPESLVDKALEINPGNAYAQKMKSRLDSGKSLSGAQLNKLVQQNKTTMTAQDMQSIQSATAKRLQDLGVTENVDAIAYALAKQASGQEMSWSEKRLAREYDVVAGELTGKYSAEWTGKIGTNKINAQEYGRLLEASQNAQDAAENAPMVVAAEEQNTAQAAKAESVGAPEATVLQEKQPSAENATGEAPLQVVEESSDSQEETVSLEDASKKYGAQAQAMIHTYTAGQDVEKYDKAYQEAYDMGKSGVAFSYVSQSETAKYLTEEQRELAYEAGKAAADAKASAMDAENKGKANGKIGRKKGGVIRGEGVKIADLRKAVGDTRGKAYKALSTIAKVTGVNIVLYKSKVDENGNFTDTQGKFDPSNPGEIRIDINAGLGNISDVNDLEKYVLLRTFSHEFTHFIEKWNPIQYNEFRKVVFNAMTKRDVDVDSLIHKTMDELNLNYDATSREVVAQSMTDMLQDSNFVELLAQKHKTIFTKLLEKLKEFAQNIRDYFTSVTLNDAMEANALKEQGKYLDGIVKLWDEIAVQAVENYQQTVAEEVVVSKKETTTTVSKSESVAKTETKAEEATPLVEKDDYGFTISDNVEHGSLEISFDNKPSDEVRHALKEHKFRWHKVKKVWFGFADRQTITDALHAAYESETAKPDESVIEHITPDEVESATQEVQKDRYDEIGDALSAANVFYNGGYEFRVSLVPGAGYSGTIKRHSDEYVSNARSTIFSSMFATRQEAVADLVGVARNNKLFTDKTEGVTENGENADNHGAVQQLEPDGRGAAQLLDEAEAEDVPGDGESRDAVADAGERGQPTVRDGGEHDHGTGDVGGHGEGSGESGDLRESDRVTAEAHVTDTDVENTLHEEVVHQVEQQSTEQPKGSNFVIGDSLDLPKGEKARYKANVEAIRLVKKLEAEGRYATEAEQVILSKYVGWGGLANAFDQRKTEWAKEFAELKELLTEEEYQSARGSTLNAHYTEISVIKAMYDGLKGLGFTGGRMLEPSSGVGNFVGAMPADMAAHVRSWTMVELDGITGMIGKYLYPNADMRIQGFEKANIPNNFMDVAIGNVPFGNYAIADKRYPKKVTSAIHNYFFAKSLDKVRPGGIVMFITSSYTMNSSDSTVRRYIMQKADLLGAIRLPDSAFKGNAGTEVVTDILVLKKRAENTNYAGEDFLDAPYTRPIDGNWNGAYINNYFNNHPEMVLGTPSFTSGMYRGDNLTYKALEDKGSLADQIREAFKSIQGKMDYPAHVSPEKANFAVERAGKKTKENGLVVKDGKVYKNTGGELIEQKVGKGVAERIVGMLEIRDAAKSLQAYQQQGLKDAEIKKARQKLNKVYDDFVKKYGFINSQPNKNAIKGDPDSFSIMALENWNPDTKKATKADIFSKNTIAPNRTVTSAKDVAEGLIVSVNQTGGVDAALIAKLTGKTEESVIRELLDSRAAFKNRNGQLETAEVYLSGNVRAKLRDAEALVSLDADYQKNVEALRAIVPEDVSYQDIFVNPGTVWIPDSVYSDFAAHMLGSRNTEWSKTVEVTRNRDTGNFTVELKQKYLKGNSYNTQKWGTNRRSFLDLFDAMLNSRSVVVKYKDSDGKTVVDKDATAAANEKIENIQKEFQEWLWQDEIRRADLESLYNETYNAIVTPKYNGDNLTVNGANAMKPLRPHQRDAVQRVIASGGNTLLAHKVGAGKTYEMAAAAMKLKQLGLVKKPMFAVPKSLVAQWGNEFVDFFPTAKLLVAEASDFTAANRKIFANRIANGDYDAVIVSYEQFEKLPISDDFARELYQEQIDSVIRAIEEAKAEKGGKSLSVKDLEKKRKQLQTKIDKLTDSAKDADNIEFEQLGIDSIFVDEAHNFKNLFYTTSMTNVSGLGNKDGSKRAFDLYTKVRYLQKLNGGRGIVFATATPVMNSMSEMYIMQKYLQPDLLDQLGLSTFDAWAKQFGEVVNGVEIKPSGQGYRVKQSFSRFKNMSELQLLFRNFADVLTEIPGLKIPKMKGGKVNVVVCEPGQYQKDYMKELEQRADNIKSVDPSVDNMLKITSDGRKISYTQRMIDPSMPYEEGCKIFRCADNVLEKYQESKAIKGTQIIFCDMATPKGKSSTATVETDEMETDMESAKLYDDIKVRLVKGGIPAKEIAFIHEADTDAKKKKLFADVNDGKVRVLIGSTGKMGVGMNAQKRIVAIHHLDAPWRPGDVEQRNGRAYRQGNINEEVENFTYVTEGSFDARLWDILERKQNFINQVMNGENVGRETEDTGEVTLSAAEVKALASGSPLIMEQVQLDTDIKKLESLYRAHRSAVSQAKQKLEADKGTIATLQNRIDTGKKDVAARVDTYSEGKFSITIGKQKFTDKKDAGIALMAAATANANEAGYTTIGKFAGFDLRVVKTHEGIKGLISGNQGYTFNTYPGNTTFGINHLISKVEGISETVRVWEQSLERAKIDMAEQEKLITQPFAKQAELDQKRARYNEVMEILNPKEEQALDSMEEDAVQYQQRKRDDEKPKKRKKATYSEVETLFMIWANGPAPVGEVKYFARFGKIHYYEKTENGCVEISNAQYNERAGRDAEKAYRRVQRQINGAADSNGDAQRNLSGSMDSNRNSGSASAVSGQAFGEKLRNDARRIVSGGGGHGSGTAVTDSNDIQHQQRTGSLSNREVLELAASELQSVDLTQAEKDALNIFTGRLDKLGALQQERKQLGDLYREQQFGTKVDREAAKQTLNRMKVLDDKIEKADAEVLSIEDKQVLKAVLQKARKVVEKQQWTKDQETLKRYRDRRNDAAAIRKYRERLRKDTNDLTDWVLHPSNKDVVKHIPDVLKRSVIPFLSSIDFTSKQKLRGGEATKADKEFMKRLNGLKTALKPNASVDGLYADYTDLPPNFMDRLQTMIDAAQAIVDRSSGEFVVNQMTSQELKELSQIVRTLKQYIQNFNKFHANAMFQHVYEAGNSTIGELEKMKNASPRTGSVSNFVLWQQMRPAYAFERFGDGGKAIYDGLRRGQSKLAFNTKTIQEFAEKAYTEQEVKAWEKQVKSINLGGDIVKMPVSVIMSFYELSKRPQALGHILGGGIRVATFKANGKKISDTGHTVTLDDVSVIIGTLTDRQKEVADNLQKFMQEQGGKWGNYVSVKRFGEEMFGEDHYFPINSDGRHLPANTDEHPSSASLYALLNMGFTKTVQEGANNRIVLYSIFDVFANHMASMAQYNAFALPIVDTIKWFNYQQKSEPDENGRRLVLGSVRDQMDRVYGVPEENKPGSGRRGYAQNFIINIIKAFNGTEAQGTPYDDFGMKRLHDYNRAQVAYNFRVVVQQPLAITRAAMLVDYASIMKGMKLNPAAIQRNVDEMRKHSGIAAWKSLGFYDVNISRGLTNIIKHDNTVMDKITDVGMWAAEKADTWTWAAIWGACKEEVIRKQHLTPKSDGFYEAVTNLFEDVVYKTQVVDSVLTKNEFLRDKGFFARAVGSFMSEPTTTASMLLDAFDKYQLDIQRGMTKQQAWKNNSHRIVRTAYVYGLGALVLAAVQAVADAFRDDDDYQEFMEKWLEAFGGNLVDELMPLNKLPIFSDVYEVVKELLSQVGVDTYGNPPQTVFMQWYDSLVKGVGIIHGKITGEEDRYTWYGGVYKLLQAISGLTGLPMGAATREIVTAWNNTVGAMAPSLKVKTYDSGEKNEIRYAYQDGYLTDDEAIALLLEKELVDTEDEAYFTIQGWAAGDGYSRYNALYDAVRNGGDVNAAMRELTSHGYTESEIRGKVKSEIRKWYTSGEVTKDQAINMLSKYTDMGSEEITVTVNKWSCKVVTGIEYDDIRDEFFAGNITPQRAAEMYVRYGGYSKDDAMWKVKVYQWQKEGFDTDSTSVIQDYETFCEPAGIDKGAYYDAYLFYKDAGEEGVAYSKTIECMPYIHSLPLTADQKTALAMCWWSESTVNKYKLW